MKDERSCGRLTTDLDDPGARPYFLWSEALTVAELERKLRMGSREERLRLMAVILREARDTDVWRFVTPQEVAGLWPELAPRLGRQRAFWEFLLGRWEASGKVRRARPVASSA